MSNIGGAEIFVVLLLALLVLGPERLPKAARQVGGFVRQIRQMSSGFQAEIRSAIDIDVEDRPFTPEEAHIRPVPAIGDRSSETSAAPPVDPPESEPDGELETEVRARTDDGVNAHGNDAGTTDERAAG